MRENEISVDINLGGEDHGYLGLFLTNAEYVRINPTPAAFEAPNIPARLVIASTATAVEAMQTRETHTEQTRIFRECKNVEKALLLHIHTAIEDKYIGHLVDEDKILTKEDIPTVIEYIFANYGKVPSEEVKQKEVEVLNITFHPAEPIVIIYRPIKQLQKLATMAGIPYSQAQQL